MNGKSKLLKRLALPALLLALALPYFICNGENRDLDDQARRKQGGTYVKLSRGMVHYELAGPETGPLVVLVHGFSMPMFVYDRNFSALKKAGFRVLRYDLYGRGYSARVGDAPHGPDLFDGQLRELLDALKLKGPIHLLGLSMGGAISVIFADRRPERIRTLTLVAPAGLPLETPAAAKLVRAPGLGHYILSAFGDGILLSNVKKNVVREDLVPELKNKYRAQMQFRGFKAGLLSTLRHMPVTSLEAEYRRVGKHAYPVRLFWGEQDRVIPPANVKLVQEFIPRVSARTLKHTGHLPPFESPARFNKELIDFLRAKAPKHSAR